MHLLLHLQLAPTQAIRYNTPLAPQLAGKVDGLHVFGFDNHSGPEMKDYALSLVKTSKSTVILLEDTLGFRPFGIVSGFLTSLSRLKSHSVMVLATTNDQVLIHMAKVASKNNCYTTQKLADCLHQAIGFYDAH